MIALVASWLIARNPALTLPYARRIAKIGMVAVAVMLASVAFLVWDHFDDKAAVEADRAVSNAQAQSDARKADERAHEAAEGKSDAVAAENKAAAEAAAKSDDPLKSGLDELRNHQR